MRSADGSNSGMHYVQGGFMEEEDMQVSTHFLSSLLELIHPCPTHPHSRLVHRLNDRPLSALPISKNLQVGQAISLMNIDNGKFLCLLRRGGEDHCYRSASEGLS